MRKHQITSALFGVVLASFCVLVAIAMSSRSEVIAQDIRNRYGNVIHFSLQAPGRREITILGYKCVAPDCHHPHMFATKTGYVRHRGLRKNVGTPCGNPQNGRQIVSRAGADADRPVLLSIPISEHLGGEDSGARLMIAHHYSSLLIITHHYAIHYSSLLIITQIALLIITHHYTTSNG